MQKSGQISNLKTGVDPFFSGILTGDLDPKAHQELKKLPDPSEISIRRKGNSGESYISIQQFIRKMLDFRMTKGRTCKGGDLAGWPLFF